MMTAHLAALPPTNTLTSGLASIDLSPILNAYRRAAITRNVLLASRHEDGVPSKPNEALHLDGIDPDDLLAEALSFEAHWDNPDVDIEVAAFFDSRPDDAQGIQMLPLVLRVPGEKERAAMVKLLQVTFYMIAMQFIVLVSSDNPTLAGWIGASGFAADTVFTSTKATARRLVDSVADSDPNDLEGVNPMWTETDPE